MAQLLEIQHGHGNLTRHRNAETAVPAVGTDESLLPHDADTHAAAEAAGASDVAADPEGARRSERAVADGQGYFGRMFPSLRPFNAPAKALGVLAQAMQDIKGLPEGDNPGVPAGYTYLGQFIDHDISLDLTPLGDQDVDPKMIRNFRTPRLDLDSLYADGPGPHRFLYQRARQKFLIGPTDADADTKSKSVGTLPNDLPRSTEGVALVGDHRNDENLIVAQTHVAFLKFHNKVVDLIANEPTPADQIFEKASRLVRWHYQWIVIHDFLKRITAPGVVDEVLTSGRLFYKYARVPFMPLEFSGAAYRMGHSMVRKTYGYNRFFTGARLYQLFENTGMSGGIKPGAKAGLPSQWAIDWRRFYPCSSVSPSPVPLNHARRFRPLLNSILHSMPMGDGPNESLPFRNLQRGCLIGLPSGQSVAAHMTRVLPAITPLTPAQIAGGPDGEVAEKLGFHIKTPLWYYLLKEAEVLGKDGLHLGPVGSRIVAEVFVGLLQASNSYLAEPGWKPTLPSQTPGKFDMSDLLALVDDINPVGG